MALGVAKGALSLFATRGVMRVHHYGEQTMERCGNSSGHYSEILHRSVQIRNGKGSTSSSNCLLVIWCVLPHLLGPFPVYFVTQCLQNEVEISCKHSSVSWPPHLPSHSESSQETPVWALTTHIWVWQCAQQSSFRPLRRWPFMT